MTTTAGYELYFVLCAFLFGMASGPLYDIVRFFRVLLGAKERKHFCAVFLTVLLDLAYMLTLGMLFAVLLYDKHDGVMRVYAVLLSLLGHLLYAKTVGRLIRRRTDGAANMIRRFLLWVFKPFICLFSNIFCLLSRQIRQKTLFFARSCVKIIRKKNKKSLEEKRSVRKASYGKRKNT